VLYRPVSSSKTPGRIRWLWKVDSLIDASVDVLGFAGEEGLGGLDVFSFVFLAEKTEFVEPPYQLLPVLYRKVIVGCEPLKRFVGLTQYFLTQIPQLLFSEWQSLSDPLADACFQKVERFFESLLAFVPPDVLPGGFDNGDASAFDGLDIRTD